MNLFVLGGASQITNNGIHYPTSGITAFLTYLHKQHGDNLVAELRDLAVVSFILAANHYHEVFRVDFERIVLAPALEAVSKYYRDVLAAKNPDFSEFDNFQIRSGVLEKVRKSSLYALYHKKAQRTFGRTLHLSISNRGRGVQFRHRRVWIPQELVNMILVLANINIRALKGIWVTVPPNPRTDQRLQSYQQARAIEYPEE